jgi:hypothetical protein
VHAGPGDGVGSDVTDRGPPAWARVLYDALNAGADGREGLVEAGPGRVGFRSGVPRNRRSLNSGVPELEIRELAVPEFVDLGT